MKYSVKYSRLTKDDIKKIYDFLNANPFRAGIAEEIVGKIRKTCNSLSLFPRGSSEILGLKDVYMTSSTRYKIFYRVEDKNKRAVVLRVVHSRRDFRLGK